MNRRRTGSCATRSFSSASPSGRFCRCSSWRASDIFRRMIVDEALLDHARDHAVRFLREIEQRHVGVTVTHDELVAKLRVPLSDDGEEAAAVVDALARDAGAGVMGNAGPRYFGFVIGGSLPVSVAADWLTTAWDQNAGIY